MLGDTEVSALSEDGLLRLRRERVAYVFQSLGLLPTLSAAENVEVPLRLDGVGAAERSVRVAVMDLLISHVRSQGAVVVVTTHDPLIADRADRVLELRSGRLT